MIKLTLYFAVDVCHQGLRYDKTHLIRLAAYFIQESVTEVREFDFKRDHTLTSMYTC